MRNVYLGTFLAAGVICGIVGHLIPDLARADRLPVMIVVSASASAPASPPAPAESAIRLDSERLAAHVLEAMYAWAPECEPKNFRNGVCVQRVKRDVSHYESIADDMAMVVTEPDELPLFADDASRGKTADLVATIAFYEGNFLPYVDDGRCNVQSWRIDAYRAGRTWSPSICDGGKAYSLWQVHADQDGGIVLTPDGEWIYAANAPPAMREGAFLGINLIKDRKLAVRVALHELRKSIRTTHGLCGYTGDCQEGGEGQAKARDRWEWATEWSRAHPLP